MSEFVTIFRGSVNAWECDIMGHFNIQFYAAKVSEGMGHLLHAMGLTKDGGIALRRQSAFSRYQGEMHAGDILEVRAAVLAVSDQGVELLAEIINAANGQLSSSFEMQCLAVDAESQQPVNWPNQVREKLTEMIAPRPEQQRPPTAGGPIPDNSGPRAETFVSSRGTIDAWDCEGLGEISFRNYYAIASDGIGPTRHRMGITRDLAATRHWGGVALEYMVRFHAPITAGEIYSLRTGLLALADKTFRVGHFLHNDTSGELTATFDIVACMFDLQARRAMALPDEIRAQAERMIIDWPPTA
ncbi:MAG: thioesterase family protein [Rhodospirillaceae bacterium]|nr:thioesterase family protein [Rhodospirillaceae bacterium]MBT5897388.1 thioesterase family protein [Rhodospirillaceae bacterium]